MNDNKSIESLKEDLQKSRQEFDTATTLVAQALTNFNERMENIEKWIKCQKKGAS